MKVWPWDWPVVTLNDNLAKNQWHIWNQHPWIRYIRCVTSILKKVNYIGCHKVFAWPSRWPWEKSYRWMILKMVEIHQVDYIDDILNQFFDVCDSYIQSTFRQGVMCISLFLLISCIGHWFLCWKFRLKKTKFIIIITVGQS